MKSIITVTVLLLLFSFQTFSQDKSNKRELLERFNIEKLKEIHKSNLDALEGLYDIKSWLLNPKNNLLEQVLNNQQNGFNIIDSRTAIKKTLLEDGSLVMEILIQSWDGLAWVDAGKFSFTYDGNNNMIEEIAQEWDGSAWINSLKLLFTYDGSNKLTELLWHLWDGSNWTETEKGLLIYDGNNNLIEVIGQVWDGSAWVNSSKITNMYNGNNNLIEELLQLWAGSAWVNSSKTTNTGSED